MAAPRLRSLFECLSEVSECRRARGKRYPLNTVLALAVAARLAGYRGVTAFAQFARLLSQEQLEAVGAFYSPSKQRYTAPSITTFHNILAALAPETLDNAIGQWTGQHSTALAPVAMDGKELRGASKQTEEGHRMMVAALEHGTGLALGQKEIDDKTNEIPSCVTCSAASASPRAPSPSTPCTPSTTPRAACSTSATPTMSSPRSRTTSRRCATTSPRSTGATRPGTKPWTRPMGASSADVAPPSTSPPPPGMAMPPCTGRRQAMRIERERETLKTGARSIEVTYCLTSLAAERAGPEQLLALVRNHWHIEKDSSSNCTRGSTRAR